MQFQKDTNISLCVNNPNNNNDPTPSCYEPFAIEITTKDAKQHVSMVNVLKTVHDDPTI